MIYRDFGSLHGRGSLCSSGAISQPLPSFSPFTFGCMSLGQDETQLKPDIALARHAMETGVWFHASPTYHRGFSFLVLRRAFDESRSQVPRMIIKVRDLKPWLLRLEVEDTLRRLGIDRIDVAQLAQMEPRGALVDDFATHGPLYEVCQQLQAEGKVGAFFLYTDTSRSAASLRALDGGWFAGLMAYVNPVQRELDDPLWNRVVATETPLLALRSFGGAFFRQPTTTPAFVQEAMDLSGCRDWTEFCLRFAWSRPMIQTTIEGTAVRSHLDRMVEVAAKPTPLPEEALKRLRSRERLSASS